MRINVIADPALKEELLAQCPSPGGEIVWSASPVPGSDCYIDLLFEKNEARIHALRAHQPELIIVNDVVSGLRELPSSFVRINGWPVFLVRPIVEASAEESERKEITEKVFAMFHKKVEWVPGHPGLITARVVSMIINEAYHALGENVSSKAEIDTAMKLGTNYPYGPFEWAGKTGLHRVCELLEKLALDHPGYQPAPLLKEEVLSK